VLFPPLFVDFSSLASSKRRQNRLNWRKNPSEIRQGENLNSLLKPENRMECGFQIKVLMKLFQKFLGVWGETPRF